MPEPKFAVGDRVRVREGSDYQGVIGTVILVEGDEYDNYQYEIDFVEDQPNPSYSPETTWMDPVTTNWFYDEDELEFEVRPKRTSGFGKFVKRIEND